MVQQSFEDFLKLHKDQLQLSGVPERYWNSLHRKLTQSLFDAGEVFSLLKIDYVQQRGDYDPAWELYLNNESGIDLQDPNHIYLIDHAWTFSISEAQEQLKTNESLRTRMAGIMGLDNPNNESDIFEELWKYCDCYWVSNAEKAEDRIPIWYMVDEVGSSIRPSQDPNFKMVPFIHIFENIAYSLIFPIRNISHGEIITRTYVETVTDKTDRAALFLPWIATSFEEVNYHQEEPTAEYFLSGYILESLPETQSSLQNECIKSKYKVYSEYDLVNQYLTDDRFVIVNNPGDADILWYATHFKNFKELSETPEKLVNQFPFEYVLTIKDLLCVIARRAESENLTPVTYSLKTELSKFVSYFQHRKALGLDNHWIIKPFNLARGLDTHITSNLNCIVRLAVSGPKIVQKYIEKPVLYYRPECSGSVKFDIRYVVLLKSVQPLQVYAYRKFFLRFANDPFSLDEFDKYTKHFTVMNYIENAKYLKRVLCDEFVETWNEQFTIPWTKVENDIFSMLRQLFVNATMKDPPCGIANNPQSRALYAADIMLTYNENNEIEPRLLEVNWMPDCKRACEYYPDFYNDIFKLFFLNIENKDAISSL